MFSMLLAAIPFPDYRTSLGASSLGWRVGLPSHGAGHGVTMCSVRRRPRSTNPIAGPRRASRDDYPQKAGLHLQRKHWWWTRHADLCSEHALRPASVPGLWWCKGPNFGIGSGGQRWIPPPTRLPTNAVTSPAPR